jgi:hypothetical protein
MTKLVGTAVFVAAIAWAAVSNATVTGEDCWAGSGGALQNSTWDWNAANNTLSIGAYQYLEPGAMLGTFTTSGGTDPTVTLENSVNNDTGFAWTAYDANVYLNTNFTLANPVVYGDTTEPGWSGVITVSPADLVASGPYTGQYEAEAVFSGGPPIPIGGLLDFSYQMSFTGGVSFTEQLIPVPEPGTLVLVLGGLIGLVAMRRMMARAR